MVNSEDSHILDKAGLRFAIWDMVKQLRDIRGP